MEDAWHYHVLERRYLGAVTVAQRQFNWLCSVAVGDGSILLRGLFSWSANLHFTLLNSVNIPCIFMEISTNGTNYIGTGCG